MFRFFWGDTLTFNNFPYGAMSGNLSFDDPITYKSRIFTNQFLMSAQFSIPQDLVGSTLIGQLKI
jgi:hypothetical protein